MKKLSVSILVFCFCFKLVSAELKTEEGRLKINGTELYYKKIGHGEPLLILHGGPGLDHSYFLPQLGSLADKYQLIFFDQRGCGRSSVQIDSNTISMNQFVDDVEAIRKAFHLEELNLLGHSFGGLIALRYAIKYPEHLKRLILINSTPATSKWRDSSFVIMQMRFDKSDAEDYGQLIQSEDFKLKKPEGMSRYFRILFRKGFFEPTYADSLTLEFQPTFSQSSKLMDYLDKDSTIVNYDLNLDLKRIKCRTLIVGAEADFAPPASLEDLRQHIKNSSYVMMEGAGHFPFIEQPKRFREILDKFMNAK